MAKLLSPKDIDMAFDPEDRTAAIKFTSYPLATQTQWIDLSESDVLSYCPPQYRSALDRLNGLLLRREYGFEPPEMASGGVSGFECYDCARDGNLWLIGDRVQVYEWPPNPEEIPEKCAYLLCNIEFGNDGPETKPRKLKELAITACIVRIYRATPSLAADPLSLQKFMNMQDQLQRELENLRKGIITIPEFEELELVDGLSKRANRVRNIMANPFTW